MVGDVPLEVQLVGKSGYLQVTISYVFLIQHHQALTLKSKPENSSFSFFVTCAKAGNCALLSITLCNLSRSYLLLTFIFISGDNLRADRVSGRRLVRQHRDRTLLF